MNDEPKNVKLIFAEALEKSITERLAYLNETCGEDSNLLAAVEELSLAVLFDSLPVGKSMERFSWTE